jgi:hypothetical protein
MAYQISGNNLIQIGGHIDNANPGIVLPVSDLSKLLTLGGGNNGGTSDFVSLASYMSPTTTAQYQIPNGKTFYVFTIQANAATGNVQFQFGYGTASLGANTSATPPTGVVYYGASSSVGATGFKGSSATSGYQSWNVMMSFPQNVYPWFRANGSVNYINLIGYLI